MKSLELSLEKEMIFNIEYFGGSYYLLKVIIKDVGILVKFVFL